MLPNMDKDAKVQSPPKLAAEGHDHKMFEDIGFRDGRGEDDDDAALANWLVLSTYWPLSLSQACSFYFIRHIRNNRVCCS